VFRHRHVLADFEGMLVEAEVNWARELSVVSVKYRLFADASDWLAEPLPA